MSDPVMDGFDAYLDEQEERAATDILEDVSVYVQGLQERIDRLNSLANALETFALHGFVTGPRAFERAKTARSSAEMIDEIKRDLMKLLDIQEED